MPETLVYQAINQLNRHFYKIVFGIAFIFLIYPSLQAVDLIQQFTKSEDTSKNLNQEITEKEQLLNIKLAEKRNGQSQELTPTKVSQQLEDLFHQYDAEINAMQWDLTQDKQINITITQKANTLFELTYQLNQLPFLRCKEITLTRLDYKNLVQLNATLQLVNQ